MDLEQIVKKLEWLDDERRKDKTVIATLEERVAALENITSTQLQHIKELSGETARLSALIARFDQLDSAIAALRVEISRSIETIEKQRSDHEREMEKVWRGELETINKNIGELRKLQDAVTELKKGLQARVEEELRLSRLIDEVSKKFEENSRADEESRRALRLLDEGRRQDAKRLTDLQGETTALRRRQDEQRGKLDLIEDSLRKQELRLGELQAAESERRQTQMAFIERLNLQSVERDRIWKEWETKFGEVEKLSGDLQAHVQTMETLQRSIRRSQEGLDEVTQRFERRINEITEMQRLVEDRFRQEWVSFKADDQKRWTNYALIQEENQRELGRRYEKLSERLTVLEDLSHDLQDTLHQVTEETQKRLQDLAATAQQWLEDYERNFGRSQH